MSHHHCTDTADIVRRSLELAEDQGYEYLTGLAIVLATMIGEAQ